MTRRAYRHLPVGHGRSWWARIENRQRYERRKALAFYYQRRGELISRLGGRCCICGSKNDLEIHKADTSDKTWKISTYITRKSEWIWLIKQCELYCTKHGNEKTAQERRASIKHGCWHSVYALKCHCEECEKFRIEYCRLRREKRRAKRDDEDWGVTATGRLWAPDYD